MRALVLPLVVLAAAGCRSLGSELPEEPPPLVSMEEPPALFQEPDDEDARVALPLGGYTGLHVTDGRRSLGGLGGEPDGVLVQRVVENSPADAAGIEDGDLIVAVRPRGGAERDVRWPSEWRDVELAAEPGTVLTVVVDRAGVEDATDVTVVRRVRPPNRDAVERYREEERVGVVLRTATEVEARAAGLGPGAGAVVVGLAAESPWRACGLRFGDLLVAVDGAEIAHPQVVLDALREAEQGTSVTLTVRRGASAFDVAAPVSRRVQTVRRIAFPPLFSYGAERGESELSILLGLVKRTATEAAWEWRILWLFRFGGGDADRLEEVP